MIDRPFFFSGARRFFVKYTQGQVDGINTLLDAWDAKGDSDARKCAYVLATSYHETNGFMQPVIETRRGDETVNPSVESAIARLENSWKAGKMPWVKTPYWRKDKNGMSWLGRGYPQVTFLPNYTKAKLATGIDFVSNPDLMLVAKNAAPVTVIMMMAGTFTSHKLGEYFNDRNDDPYNARRVINGLERASVVQGYHRTLLPSVRNLPAK